MCLEKSSCFGFGFFVILLIALSHSCFLTIAIDVILPADSRQLLEPFHFKSKQCVGYKEQSWEYSCVKLHLIIIIYFSIVFFELTLTLYEADSSILSHVKTLQVHQVVHVTQVVAFCLSTEMSQLCCEIVVLCPAGMQLIFFMALYATVFWMRG